MKNLFSVIVFIVLSIKMTAQVDSTIIAFPVNDSIIKAFALTDETIKFLPKFAVSDSNEVNQNDQMWFYIYVVHPTPEIDFVSESGMKGLNIYGPFGKQYLNAKDSIELGLKPPFYSNIDSTGSPLTKFTMPSISDEGLYLISVMTYYRNATLKIEPQEELLGKVDPGKVDGKPGPCIDCSEDDYPDPGRYVITAWVSMDANLGMTTYYGLGPKIRVKWTDLNGNMTIVNLADFNGYIIDGWQMLQGEFIIPTPIQGFKIELLSTGGAVYYDDVRLEPYNSSMKTYVYDPVSLRFVAELDERSYATFYEYDEEGRLKRIKKETERGIMTIQETNTSITK